MRMCMCVCTCVCVCVCVCASTFMCMRVSGHTMFAYIYLYICMRVYECTYLHAHLPIHTLCIVYVLPINSKVHVDICIYIHMCVAIISA